MEKYLQALKELKFAIEQQEALLQQPAENQTMSWWGIFRRLHQAILIKQAQVERAFNRRLD